MDESMALAGQRIRELRLRRGLTQKALVGEQMTRNMLSLIENGLASPSLSNIRYIAKKLDVPMGYFFAENAAEEGKYWKISAIGTLRSAFVEKRYRDCALTIQSMPVAAVDDEVAWIAAQVYFQIAMQSANGYELRTAQAHLHSSMEYLSKTEYAGEELRRAVVYYRELIQILTGMGEIPERLCDLHIAGHYIPLDMLLYFQALRSHGKNVAGTQHPSAKESFWQDMLQDTYYIRHLHALENEKGALSELRALLTDSALPFPMRNRVCNDTEDIANRVGDFKTAYLAARKKLELMELAKK